MIINLDHIAILTTSLERSVLQFPPAFTPQKIEEQPTEGTREQYVTFSNPSEPSLLLLEPILPGPYQRAMEKRGPGLHHLGCITDQLDTAIDYFSANGLFLHPISLKTYARNTAWMCRPGIPFLLEVYSSSNLLNELHDETVIALPNSHFAELDLIAYVPKTLITQSNTPALEVSIGGHTLSIAP